MMRLYDDKNSEINVHHIDVLDGIRALAIIIVMWLHIWEQCWLMPVVDTPSLSFLRINRINLDWLPRTGYMMVTMLIFLSGFCLYLPYARRNILGEKVCDTKTFFLKRVARIVPSYLFCVILLFIFDIATGAYSNPEYTMCGDSAFMWKDLFSHLTFTFTLFPTTNSFSLLNGALWTVALEVQFYIIFPLLEKAFSKKPFITYTAMTLTSFAYIFYANGQENIGFLMHQLPSYLGVYANGFLGAMILVGMSKSIKRNKYIAIASTIIAVCCMYAYYVMMKLLALSDFAKTWQTHNRYYLSIIFMIFCLASAYALPFCRKIFSCRAAVFLSTISYNLYIWHQVLAMKFKEYRIPYYEGDELPNVIGDKPWMWKHFILSIVSSLIVATLVTYFLEKPLSKLIMKLKKAPEEVCKTGKAPLTPSKAKKYKAKK